MGYSGSRHKALSSWNAVVSKLLSSISSYSSTSVSLLEKVYTEGKGRHDIPLEEALVHIDKQLQAIDNAHKLLQSCQQKLLAHRNTSHTLVPINRLPWEILSRIVVLGTEGDKEMDSRLSDYYEAEQIHEWDNISELGEVDWIAGGQEEAYEGGSVYSICPYGEFVPFPRLFAQVCRKWRNVALSTATVWTTIDFSKNSDWVKELLTRSKGCPITVVMNLEGIPSSSLDEQCSDMFLQIDPHVSRVESLHLTTSHHLYIKEMLDRWAASWSRSNPFLRRLSIRAAKVPGLIELSNQDEVSKYRDFMKKVQELEIHGVSISWDDSIFQNLTSLKLTGIGLGRESPTTMQIYQFLSSSPNLESLTFTSFTVAAIPRSRSEYPPPIDLQRLHTFSLNHSLFSNVVDRTYIFILSIINAPNLERLTMESVPGIETAFEPFIERLKKNSGDVVSKIKYLRLSNCILLHNTLVEVFKLMPQIEDLGVRRIVGFGTAMIEELGYLSSGDNDRLLPLLRTLRIIQCDAVDDWFALEDMVRIRKPSDGYSNALFETEIDKLVVKWCGLEKNEYMENWLRQNIRRVVFESRHAGLQQEGDDDIDGIEGVDDWVEEANVGAFEQAQLGWGED